MNLLSPFKEIRVVFQVSKPCKTTGASCTVPFTHFSHRNNVDSMPFNDTVRRKQYFLHHHAQGQSISLKLREDYENATKGLQRHAPDDRQLLFM